MHFLFVGFFFCMVKLCSDLKQEQYNIFWLTITVPRRHQRNSIAGTHHLEFFLYSDLVSHL